MSSILGMRIRECRKARGMSLPDLAEAASVSKAYLSDLENGKKDNPGAKVLTRVAEALHTSLGVLMGKEIELVLPGRSVVLLEERPERPNDV